MIFVRQFIYPIFFSSVTIFAGMLFAPLTGETRILSAYDIAMLLLFIFLFVGMGLACIGIPAAYFLAKADINPKIRIVTLLAIGTASGLAVFWLLFHTEAARLLGALSGFFTALIWCLFNLSSLKVRN